MKITKAEHKKLEEYCKKACGSWLPKHSRGNCREVCPCDQVKTKLAESRKEARRG